MNGLAAALIALVVHFAFQLSLSCLARFPGLYGWTELQLSYEGGFIRRGLLGEIAYQLRNWINPLDFLIFSVMAAYVVVFGVIVLMATRRLTFLTIVCLASPVLLLFPLNDAAAFVRKDIFIVGGFLASVWMAKWLSGNAALFAIMAIFIVPGLMHETAWAYFPLAVVFLVCQQGATRPPNWPAQVAVLASAYLLAVAAVIFAFRGTVAQADEIVRTWQLVLPGSFPDRHNAATWLAADFAGNFAAVPDSILYPRPLISFLIAAVLTLGPIIALWRTRPPQVPKTRNGIAAFVAALACLCLPLALAADWGRYLHIAAMCMFIFILASDVGIDTAPEKPRRSILWWAIPLILAYSSSWAVHHYADGRFEERSSFLKPGYLFRSF